MQTNRNYYYKGNAYKILGEAKMKDSEKNWIDAVRYEDIHAAYKGEFVRDKQQFENRFIPAVLRVGDKVMIISHGKLVGVTEVIDEMEDFVSLKQSIGDAPKTLSKEVSKQGYIMMHHHWEFYIYNETTCNARQIEFK